MAPSLPTLTMIEKRYEIVLFIHLQNLSPRRVKKENKHFLKICTGCGKRPSSSRVINGDNATPHSWPWQISLRVSGHYGSKHFCGGSLIRPNWVVTAAHCVYKDTDPSGYTVVVGAHRRTGTTDVQQTFNVNTLIVHEQFETRALRNDIALLKLDRPVQLSEKVATVCLPDKKPDRSANCYITGWGRIKEGRPADALQQAKMPITPHEECKKKYRKGYDRQVHLCAGEGREGSTGGCQGDSGIPFVCQTGNTWHLHGIVSFGERWCSTVYYTIFTRITTYVSWIQSKIGI
ncbi:chymotrypsinogen B-like [Montipora capricornis]|uniref:chymotrypsinogen B-like n=1 Tax=Montipora capricornis TaxID=246305 RepID=UPI0035F11BCE